MSEGRQLEVRPGDMALVSIAHNGESAMLYMSVYANLDAKLEMMRRFLLAQGHVISNQLAEVDELGESQWAVDVRNFLDRITDPEVYGLLFVGQHGREVVEDAVRLRDAR